MRSRALAFGSGFVAGALVVGSLLTGSSRIASTAPAAAASLAGPTNTTRPSISGTARDGQTLSLSKGTWNGTGTITYSYQWQRCDSKGSNCSNVSGKTGTTYTLSSADVNATIGASVTATDSGGSSTAYTDLIGPVAPKGSAPAYTTQPSISGTAKEGSRLRANRGAWSGSSPITYSYQWQRCDAAGKNCDVIPGATGTSYVLTATDIDRTVLVAVTAKNDFGSQVGFSARTSVVVGTTSLKPAYTTQPSISGKTEVGQALTGSAGTWRGATPMSFSYQWQRCDAAGKSCDLIGGATQPTYVLTSGDLGRTVVFAVTARNSLGTQVGFSAPTAVVTLAAGATISVSSVSLPNQLVLAGVSFSPKVISPGTEELTARFRVTDSAGHPVSGALVYAIGLPYGRVSNGAEAQTDGSGYATISFRPTTHISPRRGYIVFFVRARKPGENLLSGVSTRRLVQVTTGR